MLGIACFIETPSVALKESEQNKTGGGKRHQRDSAALKDNNAALIKEGCNFRVPKLPGLMKRCQSIWKMPKKNELHMRVNISSMSRS